MRIGMILDKVYPPDPRVENEAIELINNGFEVFLFCLSYEDEVKNEIIKSINVRRYKTNKFEYKLSALAYTFPLYAMFMKKKISHFLNENKIDVIHVHDMVIADAVFKVNKKNKPVVLDLHENRPEIMKFYPHLKKFPSNFLISINKWRKKEEYFINNTDRLIVVTKEAKKQVLSRTTIKKENIFVAPNTVREKFFLDLNNEYQQIEQDRFNLLYIGDTGNRRGLNTVVEALDILRDKITNIQLTIVGKVNLELKRRVKELNLEEYVSFEGWQNESTFQKYILNSTVCLSPLHRNIHHDTTYANKLFQYMSLGKPLLVSNAIAQKNLIEKVNAGLVHEEKSPKDFAEKLLIMFNNKKLRYQLGENGACFVRNKFTWDKTSAGLIKMYKELSN